MFTQKFYAFDFDDNILMLCTRIHMQRDTGGEWVDDQVSTTTFTEVRSSPSWKTHGGSFVEFRDFGPRGRNAYIEDVMTAVETKSHGPSWRDFIRCVVEANIFAIVTARGHEPSTMRDAVRYIIMKSLTPSQRDRMASNILAHADIFGLVDIEVDYSFEYLVGIYLDNCFFYGVNSDYFRDRFPELFTDDGRVMLEEAKEQAIKDFISVIHRYTRRTGIDAKLGFSDDDRGNVETVKRLFNEKAGIYDHIRFSIYDTSGGNKVKINSGNKKQQHGK